MARRENNVTVKWACLISCEYSTIGQKKVLLGGNEGKVEVDKLLAERCRVEEKGGKTPGEAAGPELDSWKAPCFWVCQPGVVDEVCCCCCWRRRSFITCFNLKKKVKRIVK